MPRASGPIPFFRHSRLGAATAPCGYVKGKTFRGFFSWVHPNFVLCTCVTELSIRPSYDLLLGQGFCKRSGLPWRASISKSQRWFDPTSVLTMLSSNSPTTKLIQSVPDPNPQNKASYTNQLKSSTCHISLKSVHHEGSEGGLPTNPENAFSLLNGANPNLGLPLGSRPSPRDADGNVAAV